ncbi:hypothetical protein SDC9_76803 [bioreactor metagenome]|uniref:Uncharacterized protein n=1 Tax=bioreactor metagenome TaxID=1076179 RepID=A0A644YNT0_9ZZZZ
MYHKQHLFLSFSLLLNLLMGYRHIDQDGIVLLNFYKLFLFLLELRQVLNLKLHMDSFKLSLLLSSLVLFNIPIYLSIIPNSKMFLSISSFLFKGNLESISLQL